MGDGEVDIVHDARERIEERAIGADENGVGKRAEIDRLRPSDEIVPGDVCRMRRSTGSLRVIEAEPPVRCSSFRFETDPVLVTQLQRGTVVDRRAARRKLAFAAAIQFIGRLEAGIEPPAGLQSLRRRFIERCPRRLLGLTVPRKPQPSQILPDLLRISFARTLPVGVVETQEKCAAGLQGKQVVQYRRPQISEVEVSGRARRETKMRCHLNGLVSGGIAVGARRCDLQYRRSGRCPDVPLPEPVRDGIATVAAEISS